MYGLDVPKIKQFLPGNYPAVTATEIHADNPFLLEDGSLLILEYESDPLEKDFYKYAKYVIYAVERLRLAEIKIENVIVAVVYTGDVESSASKLDVGALRVQVEQVFLSRFDTEGIYAELKRKIDSGEPLEDDDVMRLIILPLTERKKEPQAESDRGNDRTGEKG